MISLGSEVIIISIDDARRLLMALLSMDKHVLQRLGILDVVMDLQSIMKEHNDA